MQVILKMVNMKEKEKYIIGKEILNMKEILKMVNMKEKEKNIMKRMIAGVI